MTANEKKKLIRTLVASVKTDALAAVAKMPEDWDGIELREYLADKFAECRFRGTMDKRRMSRYRNEVLVRNL